MGNYTQVEAEFINRMNALQSKDPNQYQNNSIVTLTQLRIEKAKELFDYTNRNVITYFSTWLQSAEMTNPELMINDNDMNGFMNAVCNIDRSLGLDLILHTPGGVVTATESIVNYLHKIFNSNIRVIVPHMAMSAGTMIACSCKEIIMGKESSLGPIDPQYRGVPAEGVIKEFHNAIDDTINEPNKSLIWKQIIGQYRPTFVGECENVVKLSQELVTGWLENCMFKNSKNKSAIINKIIKEIASHDASKVHDRHYDYEKCRSLGLKVTPLEKDQILQDKVLSLYHTYLLSSNQIPISIKFIENQNGQTMFTRGKR